MNAQKILNDARDPNSKDNTFRQLWAQYQRTSFHVEQKRIMGMPLKTLEANMTSIRDMITKMRYGEESKKEETAEECLKLVQQSQTVMEQLLKL